MRFGKNIRHLSIPEWRQCYLDYQHLKIFIRVMKHIVEVIHQCEKYKQKHQIMHHEESDMTSQQISSPLDQSIKQLMNHGESINQLFFEAHIKSMGINRLFLHMKLLQMRGFESKCIAIQQAHIEKKQMSILMQIVEFIYIETCLVESAKELNLEAERKILKKHMKYSEEYFETPRSRSKKVLRIKQELNKLQTRIEQFYIKNMQGSTKKNRERIRQLAKKNQAQNSDSFIIGSWIGIFISILGVLIAILAYTNKSVETDTVFNQDFPTWRGIAIFFIYIWVLGLNVYGFEYYSISHRVIFQYNEHHYSTSIMIFKVAGFFSTFFLIMFAIYTLEIANIIDVLLINSTYLVLFVWGIFILFLINPFPIFHYQSRLYAIKIAFKSILAPFFGVTFPVIWMTDQLISLITPFKDMAYTICYYMNINDQNSISASSKQCNSASRVQVVLVVGAVAYSFRIIQCMRQGYDKGKYLFESQFFNTLKYAFSFITLILSYLWKLGDDKIFFAWVVFASLTTFYSYIWDLKVDWALFEPNSPKRFLRKNIYYPYQCYYVIIVLNFLFRIVWVATLSPSIANNAFGSPQIFSLVTGVVQIIRRGIWNMLRVQRQHIANCRNFKATPAMVNSLQKMIINSVMQKKQTTITQSDESMQNISIGREIQDKIEKINKQNRNIKSKHLQFLYQMIDNDFEQKQVRVEKAKKLKKQVDKIQENIISIIETRGRSNRIANQVTKMHE